MATYVVSGDQYREVDRRMNEIKRQLNEPAGSALDPDLVARRLQLIIDGRTAAPAGSTTPEQAATIMGPAFHGLDALEQHLGLRVSASEGAQLSRAPFSPQALIDTRDTHVLVACPRVSLMTLRARVPEVFYFKKAWYAEETFARESVRARWRLIRNAPLADSMSKVWAAQQALLGADELIPRVAEMALAIVLHYLETGERLFSTVYVRTADLDSGGRRVGLGRFGPDGLRIRSWGDYPDYYIGLAAARRSSWSRMPSASAVSGKQANPRVRAERADRARSEPRCARGS